MNDPSNLPPPHQSMDEEIKDLLRNAQESIHLQYGKFENRVRHSPSSAILGALAAGYLMHRLPMRAILLTKVRIIAAMAPPALLLFGAAKFYDFMQRRKPDDLKKANADSNDVTG